VAAHETRQSGENETMAFEQELEVAKDAARLAGEQAMKYWRSGLPADTKEDDSPVTAADRHCERILVQHLCQHFPEDGMLGEEGADKASGNGRRWILDPIDGTRDFIRGNRMWCNMLALEDNGEVVVGVVNFPALGEMYSARRGGGTRRNEELVRASGITELSRAVLCLNGFQKVHQSGFAARLFDWMKAFWAVRSLGGAPDAMLVASGSAEVWIEQSGKAWDLAPLKIIAEEAGAKFFNFDGGSSIYGGNCVICVAALETAMRRFVAG
jgi:histidinol phosphatase-like enzyme (inositol monophosphatase family)